ncbi:PhnE/PtxC family ABC transporter permease [Polymorphum gilvum]|uniref:Binding-protein-dependent transport systems inner membrane component n=1 Tax=Polymorphum gilvum (strain LMG 25793 / CGMCC 1.9160 / SL003B-26A1) TaxID=991905 RepID=F2J1C4_POLGS|nr:ABC transporter permease [Polymorphum gilvum]ADZ69706.1 Binding-protein-dependent transport systems inner membrane component [Polymorphum gilvum SL003B-26A1]
MPERLTRLQVTGAFLLLGLAALPFADLGLAGHDPWSALGRMAAGFLAPDFGAVEQIGRALLLTVAFAVAGVAAGALAGLALAPFYGLRAVRWPCIALRSVHELFWALLLMQALGIGAATGVLAIALPYAGIFAKVFAEYLEEADQRPSKVLPPGVDGLSRFLYARAPLALAPMRIYTLYRLECGLRSSAVLGFVGLPTLGFQLDSFFRQGDYGAASAIMICYIVLIASIRLWMRRALVPVWIVVAIAVLASVHSPPMGEGALWRFLSQDIVPAPLRAGGDWSALAGWLASLLRAEALPGLWATLVCAQIALVLTGAFAFAGFGLIVPRVAGRAGALAGHLVLVVLRSFPEYMLAYLFLQLFGPSMLPAILALSLHNGAIIAHLVGRQAAALEPGLRADAPRGVTLWAWEFAPRLFGPFLALCLYRWEIILRETAVMGLLGGMTLGFFIDSAVAELRLDRAVVLLVAAGALTAAVDALSRRVRGCIGAANVRSLPAQTVIGDRTA